MSVRSLMPPLLGFIAGVLLVGGWVLYDRMQPVPPSVYASAEAAVAARAMFDDIRPHLVEFMSGDVQTQRALLDEYFYGPRIERARKLYPVTQVAREIAGVYTEVFEPIDGVPEHNAGRVLINLHGGGFTLGARTEGRLESIPVASIAGMRVISVDYRQGPEHRFPAASEDVARVYSQLLNRYQPEQIGIYGCSAGGLLTAQAVAWFDAHELPMPGAIGIFCAGASEFGKGDAMITVEALGASMGSAYEIDYFADVDWNDPLAAPERHPELLSRFPPSLIITSTRDMAMSAGVVAHQRLVAAGTYSQLHVFEGLVHYFFAETGTPESREVFRITADFFDAHLAR